MKNAVLIFVAVVLALLFVQELNRYLADPEVWLYGESYGETRDALNKMAESAEKLAESHREANKDQKEANK